MKEHGILFTAPMVRAILAGTKAQTRRIAKAPKGYEPAASSQLLAPRLVCRESPDVDPNEFADEPVRYISAPHGPVGRRLWVRETWGWRGSTWEGRTPDVRHVGIQYAADGAEHRIMRGADDESGLPKFVCRCPPHLDEFDRVNRHGEELTRFWRSWRPAIHMPRWASRITLEVTRVRLERVQSITEDDARAEGVELETAGPVYRYADGRVDARSVYADLWDTISGAGSWASNPWCWVYDFKRVE